MNHRMNMKKKLKNKKTITVIVCMWISFMILFINERHLKQRDEVLYLFILTIGVSFLCTSLMSLIDGFFGNNMDEIAEGYFKVIKNCHEYGLYGIYENFPLKDEEILRDFVNSKSLYIVMNDSKAFISGNIQLFKKRVEIAENKTYFILQDYNRSDIMEALERKNGHEKGYYTNKIRDVIKYDIENLKKDKNESHEIISILNQNYNTLSIVLSDNYAMVSIYRVSSGKNAVPHFVFAKGASEFEFVKKDVDKLIEAFQGNENS